MDFKIKLNLKALALSINFSTPFTSTAQWLSEVYFQKRFIHKEK